MSAVCLHLSDCLANLRSRFELKHYPYLKLLTEREIQIANLVVQGLTNAEIGKELWIRPNTVKQALKKMFRKLEVNSRTAMIAQLNNCL